MLHFPIECIRLIYRRRWSEQLCSFDRQQIQHSQLPRLYILRARGKFENQNYVAEKQYTSKMRRKCFEILKEVAIIFLKTLSKGLIQLSS